MLSWPAEQKNVDRTPRVEIKQENRAKTFLSQEAKMKLLLEKVHKGCEGWKFNWSNVRD